MRFLKFALCVFFSFALINTPNAEVFAQKNVLPPELNEKSTVEEILEYLNKTSLPYARIGLSSSGEWNYNLDRFPADKSITPVSVIFSQGFKLIENDCHIKLRNDNVAVLSYSGDSSWMSYWKVKSPTIVDVWTSLENVSYDKGKNPYQHTKNAEEAKIAGTWRTEFEYKRLMRKSIFYIVFPDWEPKYFTGYLRLEKLSFTFDDKEISEKFNVAFRRAIKLCQQRGSKPFPLDK